MSSLCQNPELCIICLLYCSDSASYCFEVNMLISLVGTLTQIRMEVGSIIFHARGP